MSALPCLRRIVLVVPLLLLTLSVAGCGQKGPLFFPPAVPEQPASAQQGGDDEGADEQVPAATGG